MPTSTTWCDACGRPLRINAHRREPGWAVVPKPPQQRLPSVGPMTGRSAMDMIDKAQDIDTVVIGAGQAGLATGYYLAERGRDFVILDAYERVGDNWRCHWDSLRLYSPALAASLPGMRFPGQRTAYPTKDEMADFLEAYQATFRLPVRGGVRVSRVRAATGPATWSSAPTGRRTRCDNVVVATGTFGRTPHVPAFAGELDPGIRQLHSSDYKRPSQLRPGGVLVVGASHSGRRHRLRNRLRRSRRRAQRAHPRPGSVPVGQATREGCLPGPVLPGPARADPSNARSDARSAPRSGRMGARSSGSRRPTWPASAST